MKRWTFEFLTRARAFDRTTTDDQPKPDRVVTVEAADETAATLAAYGQLKPNEIRRLICANVVRPQAVGP